MLKSLTTIAALLLLLMGCARYEEAKAREGCQKAYPNNEVAANKCFETSIREWEEARVWIPVFTHRKSPTP